MFPARAGMNRTISLACKVVFPACRTVADFPQVIVHNVFPARAGMNRSTDSIPQGYLCIVVFPARAGMNRPICP